MGEPIVVVVELWMVVLFVLGVSGAGLLHVAATRLLTSTVNDYLNDLREELDDHVADVGTMVGEGPLATHDVGTRGSAGGASEHERLADAVSEYLDAIGCEEAGDLPTILERLAAQHEASAER